MVAFPWLAGFCELTLLVDGMTGDAATADCPPSNASGLLDALSKSKERFIKASSGSPKGNNPSMTDGSASRPRGNVLSSSGKPGRLASSQSILKSALPSIEAPRVATGVFDESELGVLLDDADSDDESR